MSKVGFGPMGQHPTFDRPPLPHNWTFCRRGHLVGKDFLCPWTFCRRDVLWKDVLWKDVLQEGRFEGEDVLWEDVLQEYHFFPSAAHFLSQLCSSFYTVFFACCWCGLKRFLLSCQGTPIFRLGNTTALKVHLNKNSNRDCSACLRFKDLLRETSTTVKTM